MMITKLHAPPTGRDKKNELYIMSSLHDALPWMGIHRATPADDKIVEGMKSVATSGVDDGRVMSNAEAMQHRMCDPTHNPVTVLRGDMALLLNTKVPLLHSVSSRHSEEREMDISEMDPFPWRPMQRWQKVYTPTTGWRLLAAAIPPDFGFGLTFEDNNSLVLASQELLIAKFIANEYDHWWREEAAKTAVEFVMNRGGAAWDDHGVIFLAVTDHVNSIRAVKKMQSKEQELFGEEKVVIHNSIILSPGDHRINVKVIPSTSQWDAPK